MACSRARGVCPARTTPAHDTMSGDTRRFEPHLAWDDKVEAYLAGALGREALGRISAALTTPPAACARVNTLRTTPQSVLDHVLGQRQPGASTSGAHVHPKLPIAVIMPREGPLPVDYSVTEGREVVISRKTAEAVLRGAPVYVQGVLAASKGITAGQLVAVSIALELPGSQWCGITRGTVLGSTHSNAPGLQRTRDHLHVGVARACMGRAEMFQREQGVALVMEQPVFRVPLLTDLEGDVMLQNLPSVVAGLALRPSPGSRVIDMCAAPGGKTTLLAQLMGNQGSVTALDRTHAKAQEVMSLARELGVTCVQAYKMDATKALHTPECSAQQQHGSEQQGQGGSRAASQQHVPQPRQGQQAGGAQPLEQPQIDPSQPQHQNRQEQADKAEQLQGSHQAQQPISSVAGSQPECRQPESQQQPQQPDCQQPACQGKLVGDAKVIARLARKQAARVARGLEPVKQRKRHALPTAATGGLTTAATSATATDATSPAEAADAVAPAVDDRQGHTQTHTPGNSSAYAGLTVPDQPPQPPPGFEPESFDYVLLDAPCSALGLRPRLLQTATLDYLWQSGLYTRRLLDVAVRLLKPGGRLVFSTCTISPWENEACVRYVLDKYPSALKLVPAEPRVGGDGLVGRHLTGGLPRCFKQGPARGDHKSKTSEDGLGPCAQDPAEGNQEPGASHSRHSSMPRGGAPEDKAWSEEYLTEVEAAMVQRFDPCSPEDTIGFFVAAIEKTATIM